MDKRSFYYLERIVQKAVATDGYYDIPSGGGIFHEEGAKDVYYNRAGFLCV